MRLTVGRHVVVMWHALKEKKGNFIPDLIGSLLEMTLLKQRGTAGICHCTAGIHVCHCTADVTSLIPRLHVGPGNKAITILVSVGICYCAAGIR